MHAIARLAILGDGPLDDFLGLDDLDAIERVEVAMRRGISGGILRDIRHVDVAARTISILAVEDRETGDISRLGEILEDIELDTVQDRLLSVFPPSDDRIIVASSPDADALPGACIITEIEQVVRCPQR